MHVARLSSFNPIVEEKLAGYSVAARDRFLEIRALIIQLAETNQLGDIEETLKWGQPSYLCKSGSTVRVDWQDKRPDSVDIFFNCKTILVETFKEIFPDGFVYRGNRVLEVSLDEPIPESLETCLLMALNYHKLKKLTLLGA